MKQPINVTVARLIDIRNLFEGTVLGHDPENNCTRLVWAGGALETPYSPEFNLNEKLDWCISPAEVLLHRRVQPSRGIKENPVYGKIEELVSIGGTTNIIIKVTDKPGIKLYMDLAQHVVRRNSLKTGEEIGVSLLKRYCI